MPLKRANCRAYEGRWYHDYAARFGRAGPARMDLGRDGVNE